MRTLAITQNLSADGSPEFLGDWFDPTAHAPDLNEEVLRQSEREDVLLLGRRTFEEFRSFWPHRTDDETGISAHLDRVHKAVVSSTLGDPGWENSSVLGADWPDGVRELKEQDGGDIVCTGSLTLCPALIEAGLVDEYRLFTFPPVQGPGRRLFPEGFEGRLVLRECRSLSSGVVLTRYAAAS